jgi:hypothetical protein
MATYDVSLDLTFPNPNDEALDRMLRQAIEAAACVARDVTPTALLIEADLLTVDTLEAALREGLEKRGGKLNRILFARR